MTDETLTPIADRTTKAPAEDLPLGRAADRLAMILAGLGTVFSCAAAIWFFAGFAENDTRPEHLASALGLTIILFAFAILPFGAVTFIARRAYQTGTTPAPLLWTLFLMLPWVILGSLAVSHTPLPIWCGLVFVSLSAMLCIWALISLILDRRNPR